MCFSATARSSAGLGGSRLGGARVGGARVGGARVLRLDRYVSVHVAPGVHTSLSTVCEDGAPRSRPQEGPQDLLHHWPCSFSGPPTPQNLLLFMAPSTIGPPPPQDIPYHRNSCITGHFPEDRLRTSSCNGPAPPQHLLHHRTSSFSTNQSSVLLMID